MPTPLAQAARVDELAERHAHVLATPLPGGRLSVVASTAKGAVKVAEVLSASGVVLTSDEALIVLGQTRAESLDVVDVVTVAMIAHLALRIEAGEEVNLAAIARETGIARSTLYKRLEELGVSPAAAAA